MKYVLCYFSLRFWPLDSVSFFLCERGEQRSTFLSILMHRPPLSYLYNLTNAQLSIFFPFSQSEIYRQEARHAVTTIVPLSLTHTHAYTHTQSTSAGLGDNAANV